MMERKLHDPEQVLAGLIHLLKVHHIVMLAARAPFDDCLTPVTGKKARSLSEGIGNLAAFNAARDRAKAQAARSQGDAAGAEILEVRSRDAQALADLVAELLARPLPHLDQQAILS